MMMRWSTFAVIGLGLACLLGFVHAGELPTRPKTGDEAVVRDPPKPNVPAKPAPKAEGPAKVSAKTQTFAGIEFCWIPPGTFTMGSPVSEEGHGDLSDESQHEVTLRRGFWLGKYEVTQAQWVAVMGSNPSHFKGDDLPVEEISWYDCQSFIRKLNLDQRGDGTYRLPTEAEWEYACRAGTTTPFHFGNEISTDYANYNENFKYYGDGRKGYWDRTIRVGTFSPNAWGLFDMHGNVWEWCQDWYDENPSRSVTDPQGPGSGEMRTLRGGSWYNAAEDCRAACRWAATPNIQSNFIGFRLLRTSIFVQ